MSSLQAQQLLSTGLVSVADVACDGGCKHHSAEECAAATLLIFPYRGLYVRHAGKTDSVAEANQLLFFNAGEAYRVSHPVEGGDACLSLRLSEEVLRELTPQGQLASGPTAIFRKQRRRIDPRTQAMVTLLRYGLREKVADTLEAETMALTLVRRALGESTSHGSSASWGLQKLVDRAKLALSSDLARRWTLAEAGKDVGVSPVYLTQAFKQVEGLPLYRYHLNLRLARALDLLSDYDDLTALALDLGFSSHSHFTQAFRKAYGSTPGDFRRAAQLS